MPKELARAKVNLTLHVTGRRDDGYHELDSLVVFPEIGDMLSVAASEHLSLTIDGPFATGLSTGGDNLVFRAAHALRTAGQGAALHLHKMLPVASGIGGGSADAAAAARLLSRYWDVPIGDLLPLGADIPVCLASRPARMSGIGDVLTPVAELPEFWVVLVNDLTPVSTGPVFAAMASTTNPPMGDMPRFADAADLAGWLRHQRNDLEVAATQLHPGIDDVISAISGIDGCLLARMSGSGGTCFGLFAARDQAEAAQAALQNRHGDWWCVAGPISERPRDDKISKL